MARSNVGVAVSEKELTERDAAFGATKGDKRVLSQLKVESL